MDKKTLSNFLNCLKIDDIGITEEQFEKVKERLLFLIEPILTEDIDLAKYSIDAFNQKKKEKIDKLVHRSDKRDPNWKPHPIEIHKSVKEDSLDLKDTKFKLINVYGELSPEDKKLVELELNKLKENNIPIPKKLRPTKFGEICYRAGIDPIIANHIVMSLSESGDVECTIEGYIQFLKEVRLWGIANDKFVEGAYNVSILDYKQSKQYKERDKNPDK